MQLQELTINIPPYLQKFLLQHLKQTSQGHFYYCGKSIIRKSNPPRNFCTTIDTKFIVDNELLRPQDLQHHLLKKFDTYFLTWFLMQKSMKNGKTVKNIDLVTAFIKQYDITEDELKVESLLRKWQRAKNNSLIQIIFDD